MAVFLDFEAAGYSGHPIEVAWASDDLTRGWSTIIRPHPSWTEWSLSAAAIHGLTRERIQREGLPVAEVMARLNDSLSGDDIISDNPAFETAWLRQLAHAAQIRQQCWISETSFGDLVRQACHRHGVDIVGQAVILEGALYRDAGLIAHRALDDAIAHALKLQFIEMLAMAQAGRGREANQLRDLMVDRASALIAAHGRRP